MALAVAFPFLFSYTQPPSTNFWPLMAAGLCGWVVAVVWNARSAGRVNTVRGGWMDRSEMATWLGAGLLLAAVLASAIGLLQYFGAAPGLDPWVHASKPGQAMGNLRQRNQQATLLSMGLWALLWVVAQTEAHLRASSAGGGSAQAGEDLHGGGRPWPLWLVGILTAWALALLAVGSAATASRTGLAQWCVVGALLVLWRVSLGRLAVGLALVGLVIYGVAAWLLPELLLQWTGFRAEGLFARFGDAPGCTSRRVLWSNVLYLIAQKPWLGWGWGELDFAHYSTLFPGERFCVLLDNAHNLPLHLAVELGVPAAVLACSAVLAWIWRARPWRETDPARQLAWGILALVGLHSMLEFPLWYGPFQLVTVLAVLVLWRSPAQGLPTQRMLNFWKNWPIASYLKALAAIIFIVTMVWMGWSYHRVSQVFKPVEQRTPSLREGTLDKVSGTWLFSDAVDFARLTTMPVNRETAERVHALATSLLHYSPEPRVIEPLIESAALLGRDDEVAYHLQRFRAAYPKDYARWTKLNRALGPSHSGGSSPP
ncbi:pilin glycosylation ligase PglL [Simplicispira sp. 125]|nr:MULTISPECIES: Wzy polymerase domain-containing protein [unclassified Simplicispira]PVY57372.1 pilin glycosylation ligase PglL [Simplicispira sp. 125]REG18317.1 pilin glycosylation ligase PglL [Simplicispira sp. 110]